MAAPPIRGLGMIAPPVEAVDSVPVFLQKILPDVHARLSSQDIRRLQEAMYEIASPRLRREAWIEILQAESIVWPANFLDWLAQEKKGRRLRLKDHQLLVSMLISVLFKLTHTFAHQQSAKRHSMCMVAVILPLDEGCQCERANKDWWPVRESSQAYDRILNCPKVGCRCRVNVIDLRYRDLLPADSVAPEAWRYLECMPKWQRDIKPAPQPSWWRRLLAAM